MAAPAKWIPQLIVFCAIGMLIDGAILLRNGDGATVIWHIAQYAIIAFIIAPLWSLHQAILGGVILMALVDAWLAIESIVGFHTIVTMTFSLASVIKFVALFPVNGDVRSKLRKMGGGRTDVLTLNGESSLYG